jgi:hypothetical protein
MRSACCVLHARPKLVSHISGQSGESGDWAQAKSIQCSGLSTLVLCHERKQIVLLCYFSLMSLLFYDIVLYLCCLSMFILFLFVSNVFPSCLVFGMYLIVFVFCFFWLAIVRCLCHTCAIPSPARPWIITRWETS